MRRISTTEYESAAFARSPQIRYKRSSGICAVFILILQMLFLAEAFCLIARLSSTEAEVGLNLQRTNERFTYVTSILRYLMDNAKNQGNAMTAQPAPETAPDSPLEPQAGVEIPTLAKITAPKVNLRSGPGENFPAVMSLSRGTSLVVLTKQKDWWRVYAPTGEKLWALANLLEADTG